MKVFDYIIVLKRPSYQLIDWVSRFMLLLSIIALVTDVVMGIQRGISTSSLLLFVVFLAAVVGWWIFCFLQQKKGITPFYRFGLMMAAWAWFITPGASAKLMALIYIIACAIEKPVKLQPEIAFDKEEILFNSFPKKRFTWNEVSNIILKDGLLTIDLHNNQLIQRQVDATVNPETEAEFNEFCNSQLSAVSNQINPNT